VIQRLVGGAARGVGVDVARELHEEGGDALAETGQRGAQLAREVEGRPGRGRARERRRLDRLARLDLDAEERAHALGVDGLEVPSLSRSACGGERVVEDAGLARRVLERSARTALRLRDERRELQPLAQRRRERGERLGRPARFGLAEPLGAQARERPVRFAGGEPGVERGGELGAVGTHPPGLAIARERPEHAPARDGSQPAARLDRIAHDRVDLAAGEESRDGRVVRHGA
jgi:hypothetical protein